jgi:hypothetical protein
LTTRSTAWEGEEEGGEEGEGVTPAQGGDQDPLLALSATGDTQSEPTAGKMIAQPAIINMNKVHVSRKDSTQFVVYQEYLYFTSIQIN